jgi:hypothetical protein
MSIRGIGHAAPGAAERAVALLRAILSRAAAEKFLNDSLDFFKMRRCVEDLHPDPAFPGCIYQR